MSDFKKIQDLIESEEARFADLRFCDTRGKEQHVTIPAKAVTEALFEKGHMFDGSSIAGWKGIQESDMILLPDPSWTALDPFFEEPTVLLRCDVLEPSSMQGYIRDPRSLAKRAEIYLKSTGIAEHVYMGPEPEFFIFDDVRWRNGINGCSYRVDSDEGHWNSGEVFEEGNIGHRPAPKGGYFPVPPVDSLQDLRSAMCQTMERMGLEVELHHHEVATAGQGEIGVRYNTLTKKADELLILKYVIQNVAHTYGKTATFMPKPLVGDNGNGMHTHQSLADSDGNNLFAGDGYGGLSPIALHYIGGIFKHVRAINAFANAGTNSYRRLVPGFEAPVLLAYSARNRSAACRIPWVSDPRQRRLEIRFPDSCGNPYLAFSAMLMAGLDGILNKIDPGAPMDKDLYDLPPEEEKNLPRVCSSLEQALEALDQDRDFLKAGDVFSDEMIDGYLELKRQETQQLQLATHPLELDLYYSL